MSPKTKKKDVVSADTQFTYLVYKIYSVLTNELRNSFSYTEIFYMVNKVAF